MANDALTGGLRAAVWDGLRDCQAGQSGKEGEAPGNEPGGEVVTRHVAHGTGHRCGHRCADHVRGEDPAEHDRPGLDAVDLAAQRGGWGNGGDPVQAEQDHHDEYGWLDIRPDDDRQRDEGDTAEAVVDEQEHARVEAVGEPA